MCSEESNLSLFFPCKIRTGILAGSCRDLGGNPAGIPARFTLGSEIPGGQNLAGILPWILPRFSPGEISRWDSCRDTRREFFPGSLRIPPGKRATLAESWRGPGKRRESWWDPGEIPVPILQGLSVLSEMWPPKVCGVVLHFRLLRIWVPYKALYGFKIDQG